MTGIKKNIAIKFYFRIILMLTFFACFANTEILCAQTQPQTQTQDSIEALFYTPRQLKRFGNNAMLQGDFYAASKYFTKYLKFKPKDYKVAYRLAESYRINRDYENAQTWYATAFDNSNEQLPLALYYHGLMLKMNGNCTKAKDSFLKFKKLSGGNPELASYVKQMKNELAGCDSVSKLVNHLSKISVIHLDSNINKINIESAPLMTDEKTMIYSSMRTDKKLFKYSHPDSVNTNFRKFYKAEKQKDEWKYAGELEGPFNSTETNSTNGTYSLDGDRFYFTRCAPNWKNEIICAIYVSEKSGNSWSEPVKLNSKINNPKYTSTQPSASIESKKGNEVVYFSSNNPDGRGGLDLWYFIYDLKNKTYSTPKNLGNKINTAADETTPYFDKETQSLFFSSTGWPGMGGLDIFKARGELKKFSSPENIGAPVNSSYDDLYYTEGKNREEGFFVSNRKGSYTIGGNPTCCDDIYAFKRTEYIKLKAAGTIYSSKNGVEKSPVKNAVLSLYMIDPRETEPILIKKFNADANGNYNTPIEAGYDYKIVAEGEGYLNNSGNINSKNLTTSQTIQKDVSLTALPEGVIEIKNIYYEFGKAELTANSTTVIDTTLLTLMQENPEIKIEIGSHTDSKGSDDFNMKLSQQRAESVVNYLISKGIERNRLVAKGYGETKPIAPNTKTDGSDNPEGREKNRRTEFKIVGKIKNKTFHHETDDY